jgi:hypothetical protein
MSDQYDTIILMIAAGIFACIAIFGNRDVWRSGRRTSSGQYKTRPRADWPIALAALMTVLISCAVALQK